MRIAVAGATGAVGRHVVDVAEGRGHEVVPLARAHGIDLVSGDGVDGALDGVEAVVDVVNASVTSARASTRFFTTTTARLLRAGRAAGVRHHLALSVVGVDAAPAGYYAGKVAQESLVAAGDLPWTILRATQLHEFVPQVLDTSPPGPLALVPRGTIRPVAASEVAAALVDAAEAGPRGRVPDLAGPQVEQLTDLARRYLRARGSRRRVVPVRLPGGFFGAMRDGSLLPDDDAELGTTTFVDWLTGTTTR